MKIPLTEKNLFGSYAHVYNNTDYVTDTLCTCTCISNLIQRSSHTEWLILSLNCCILNKLKKPRWRRGRTKFCARHRLRIFRNVDPNKREMVWYKPRENNLSSSFSPKLFVMTILLAKYHLFLHSISKHKWTRTPNTPPSDGAYHLTEKP